jgi:hypothetical protein
VDVSDFEYELPAGQIAQFPAAERTGARLLVLDRHAHAWTHHAVADLPGLLAPRDLLVIYDDLDLPLGKIPSAQWVTNVAFFQLVLLAYDLAHWFKWLCLPPRYLHATLETLRTDLLVVPARLVRRGGRNVLHLPRDYHHRELFLAAYRNAGQRRLSPKT